MGIRIDSISRREFGRHFSWHLRAKGYEGLGIYFSCWTGVDGGGLFARNDLDREVEELLAADMFRVHSKCTAEQVVHRVAAALVMIGWGPEYVDDRDAFSDGRSVNSRIDRVASLEDLMGSPL